MTRDELKCPCVKRGAKIHRRTQTEIEVCVPCSVSLDLFAPAVREQWTMQHWMDRYLERVGELLASEQGGAA
ncbi:MAG: hypothetical protein OXH52_12280 [Gammaproteobacteria bacterium]|nr:hypothetical protein [Gammaproteobacteria bacterium]